jgi:hypothetical protein
LKKATIVNVVLFVATLTKKKATTTSLLPSPIFSLSKKNKTMGANNKLIVVALFTLTTRKEKKNAMTTSLLPSSSLLQVKKRKNWATIASLLSLPCSQQKTKKQKVTTHLRRHLFRFE